MVEVCALPNVFSQACYHGAVSKKIYAQRLKATVTKRWCLEQLNTFSVCGGKCPRTNQVDGHV